MRSFQELYDNYFPEIEDKVNQFTEENHLQIDKNLKSDILENILKEHFDYTIQSEDFERYGTLNNLRSLFIPEKKITASEQKA